MNSQLTTLHVFLRKKANQTQIMQQVISHNSTFPVFHFSAFKQLHQNEVWVDLFIHSLPLSTLTSSWRHCLLECRQSLLTSFSEWLFQQLTVVGHANEVKRSILPCIELLNLAPHLCAFFLTKNI